MTKSRKPTPKKAVKKTTAKPAAKKPIHKSVVKKVVAKKSTEKKTSAKRAPVKKATASNNNKKTTAKQLTRKPHTKARVSPVVQKESPILGDGSIFIQIASYRDPELVPTIKDILAKAAFPNLLRFGICRQFHELDGFDNLDEFRDDPRFRILDVPWQETLGLCWARAKIQELYAGETYTLQLDSHHRFVDRWDEILVNMLGSVDSPKPILTAYCPAFDPTEPEAWDLTPIKMIPGYFTSYGTIAFRPVFIEDGQSLEKPIPGRFVSGHFFFTSGMHCLEYKYDPNIYFAGDEISLSIRSYTLGYDIFHPHRSVVAHNYQTYDRPRHWIDHDRSMNQNIAIDWQETNESGLRRLRQMLGEEDNGIDLTIYGLGSARTHAQYEAYAGIDFSEKKIHPFALFGFDPPTTSDLDWGKHKASYNREVNWVDISEQLRVENLQKLYIGFDDIHGQSLYSEIHEEPEIISGQKTKLQVSFLYNSLPQKLVFYCINNQGEWVKRVEKLL